MPRFDDAKRPILVVNPADDHAFALAAEHLLSAGVASPLELETRLRVRYPRTVVHSRELTGESFVIWYVYREGQWRRSGTATERKKEVIVDHAQR